MGWWSSNPEPSPTTQSPASAPTPPASTPPSNPDSDFHAAYPHLAPATPPSAPTNGASDSPNSFAPDPEYPTTMSCRATFDAAFYCSSLGGHFNDIYRHGQLRSCSEHWADWRFCMALSGSSDQGRVAAIQQRYKEKEAKTKAKPNSEDVWVKRRPEERIAAFSKAEEEAMRVKS